VHGGHHDSTRHNDDHFGFDWEHEDLPESQDEEGSDRESETGTTMSQSHRPASPLGRHGSATSLSGAHNAAQAVMSVLAATGGRGSVVSLGAAGLRGSRASLAEDPAHEAAPHHDTTAGTSPTSLRRVDSNDDRSGSLRRRAHAAALGAAAPTGSRRPVVVLSNMDGVQESNTDDIEDGADARSPTLFTAAASMPLPRSLTDPSAFGLSTDLNDAHRVASGPSLATISELPSAAGGEESSLDTSLVQDIIDEGDDADGIVLDLTPRRPAAASAHGERCDLQCLRSAVLIIGMY
jgi:hypothetical protein